MLVLLLIVLWWHGTFDRLLVNVGLNAQPCGRNAFGATFCGKELAEYRARQERVEAEWAGDFR